MVAGGRFLDLLRVSPFQAHGLRASLHGSLAFTGKGHATDRATILGLAGFVPDSYDHEKAEAILKAIHDGGTVSPPGLRPLAFAPAKDLIFDYGRPLAGHANGMILMATDAEGDVILQETYYSIGGGFVVTEGEHLTRDVGKPLAACPFPFETAAVMLEMASASGKSIAEMKRANELAFRSARDLDQGMARIWQVMNDCIQRGLVTDGILPGGLMVRRRAKGIHDALQAERGQNQSAPHTINDWMVTYAMAVNEENAAGGQVVTAPTNGAAGVLPAVIRYWLRPCARRQPGEDRRLPSDGRRHRRHRQDQRLDFRRRMRLSGRSGIRLPRWPQRASVQSWAVRSNRWKTPPKLPSNITSA